MNYPPPCRCGRNALDITLTNDLLSAMTSPSDPQSRGAQIGRGAMLVLAAALVAVSALILPVRLAIVSALLGTAMLAIAVIDADRFIVPDRLSLPAIAAGLLVSGNLMDPGATFIIELSHLVGAILASACLWAIAAAYRRWRGEDGLGFGDVKLASAAGAWVGLELLPLVLVLAAGTALAAVLANAAWRGIRLDQRMRVPFGAFLAPSIWVVWVLAASGTIG